MAASLVIFLDSPAWLLTSLRVTRYRKQLIDLAFLSTNFTSLSGKDISDIIGRISLTPDSFHPKPIAAKKSLLALKSQCSTGNYVIGKLNSCFRRSPFLTESRDAGCILIKICNRK